MNLSKMEMASVAAMADPNLLEIATHTANWPSAKDSRKAGFGERLLAVLYRVATPTLELPVLLNYGEMSERLLRGAQPGKAGFQLLKGMGVDTVINLRLEAPDEAPHVRSLGMRYFYFPMDPMGAPTHEQTLSFLSAVCDPDHGRVFFHCYHGADRTGVLAACFRIAHDGWSLLEAVGEMDKHKFHRTFQGAKLEYLLDFEAHWRGMSAEARARVLHRL
jgi:protein tyrosine/serine phosphatase